VLLIEDFEVVDSVVEQRCRLLKGDAGLLLVGDVLGIIPFKPH
jgi:hypothetical protein